MNSKNNIKTATVSRHGNSPSHFLQKGEQRSLKESRHKSNIQDRDISLLKRKKPSSDDTEEEVHEVLLDRRKYLHFIKGLQSREVPYIYQVPHINKRRKHVELEEICHQIEGLQKRIHQAKCSLELVTSSV